MSNKRTSRITLFAMFSLAALTLGGCAALPSESVTTDHSMAARPARPVITRYALDGRIMVRQGERRHTTGISWQHSPTQDEILLTTPLGQGIAKLRHDADGARLLLADQREFRAADWEALAVQVFGFTLPLNALPHWLVGEAPANAQSIERDALGRLQYMRIDGWNLTYLDYERATADALPTLIELRRADIEARLKIDDWTSLNDLPAVR